MYISDIVRMNRVGPMVSGAGAGTRETGAITAACAMQ